MSWRSTSHPFHTRLPTLIVHGDADQLVPFEQSEAILARFKEVDVRSELVVRSGRGHDFAGVDKDVAAMADWFDQQLQNE